MAMILSKTSETSRKVAEHLGGRYLFTSTCGTLEMTIARILLESGKRLIGLYEVMPCGIFAIINGLSVWNAKVAVQKVICKELKTTNEEKRSNMPKVTQLLLRAVRPKLISAERPWTEVLQVRGPGNSSFLIEMHQSKDVYEVRFLLKNFILGKHKCVYEESGIPQFERNGFIITKPVKHYNQVSKRAVIHSNAVGAERVIEMRDSKQLQFVCQPNRLVLTSRRLAIFGYEIDSTGVTYFPLRRVALQKRDKVTCEKFLRVVETLPNVVKVYDNIWWK